MNSVVGRAASSIEGFWSDKARQLQLFKQLERRLRINQPIDWYNISHQDLFKGDQRTRGILGQYNNSLGSLLSTLYPDVQWDITK
jgi:hypothetical protein